MMNNTEFPPYFEPREMEKEITGFWENMQIYSRVREKNSSGKKFFFVDGPPYTTGRIHLGTAWNKVIKDTYLRYLRMRGFNVIDRPGWDMHGLPIEVKVENELGFTTKKDIEEFGVERFIKKCMEYAVNNMEEMTKQFQRLGVWMDWENPYVTVSSDYISAAWWTLEQAYRKGLLEKGKRVVNWCPRCETAIADAEVEYWDETDPSIYVRFPLKDREREYIVIWTTTPWTLPANMAVAVHPSLEYARARISGKDGEEYLIIARELLENVLSKAGYESWEIVDVVLGEDLVGTEYIHPLADLIPAQKKFAHKVYMAEFVTAENTGCVHVAPGHGYEDYELGLRENLEIFCPVRGDGVYTGAAGKYKGMHVKEANRVIIEDLRNLGLLLAEERITHRYGHCWRCKTPILYIATEQWFLRISELKELMLKEIEKVEWFPEWAGKSRFYDWVSNARDWCISRQRYWGIPIPVWECECGEIKVVGNPEELGEYDDMKLHRPAVDKITFRCNCGGEMKRVTDVFDVWFDSGVASWATLGYPHREEGFKDLWPADFITEGHDQTRGWFYSQLGASAVAFGRAPYRKVLMHGFTLDDKGRKMSKSLGNVVQPEEVIEKVGVDAFRLYVLGSNAPWEDIRFSWSEVENALRTLNILWNTCRFAYPYMLLDNYKWVDIRSANLETIDKWIISKVENLVGEVAEFIEKFEYHRALRKIENFIMEDFSRWYIQLVRPRAWEEKESPAKIAAYATISHVVDKLLRILAPFAPFITEKIYQIFIRKFREDAELSIHMESFPEAEKDYKNMALEKDMEISREIVEAVLSARQKKGRKLRWPVKKITVVTESDEVRKAVRSLYEIIRTQTNSKEIDVDEVWDKTEINVRVNFSYMGPVLKDRVKDFVRYISDFDPYEIKEMVEKGEDIEFDGVKIDLSRAVEIETNIPERYAVEEFSYGTVYVDLSLDGEILKEGYAREITRRIQEMRKEMDLQVDEFINVWIDMPTGMDVGEWVDYVRNETRAEVISFVPPPENVFIREWNIDGKYVKIGIKRIEK